MARKPNDIKKFWNELKRRNVIQVTTAYAAVSFIILQLLDIIAQPLHLPEWTLQYLIILLCIGFIMVVLFSWIYDFTSGGVKKTKSLKSIESDKEDHIPEKSNSWRVISYVSITIIFLLIAFNIFSRKKSVELSKLEKSIAVLPFINDSPSDSNQYFINGLMDEILNNLQKIKDLRVISRTSVEQFRNTPKSIPEIAKELGVNYVVEGSGQKYGSTFSLRVQLIKAAKEDHLWAESYKQVIKNVNDIYSIQSQIAQKISAELKATIMPDVKLLIGKPPTDNVEAYQLYLIGNSLMLQSNEGAYKKAINNYLLSIDLDSSFAQPYVGLAFAYLEFANWMVSSPSSEFISKARDYALKALEIDENLGEAYYIIGALEYLFNWNWIGAEQAFKKGIALNPNYVYGRIYYANFLSAMRRFKESIEFGQKTLELNPVDPTVINELAGAMMMNDQEKEALNLFNKSLLLDPNSIQTLSLLDWFYNRKGIFSYTLGHWEKLKELSNKDFKELPAYTLMYAGEGLALAGRRNEVSIILNELNRRNEEGDLVSLVSTAYLLNALGEVEKAIDLLEIGFNKKSPFMVGLKIEFAGDSIQSNIRYKELLRKMGFKK